MVGGTAYMVISNYLAKYITRWEMFLGAALLVIAFGFRKGIMGYIRELVDRRIKAGRHNEVERWLTEYV